MKSTWPLTLVFLALASATALAIGTIARQSTAASEARIAALTAACNCQTEVVVPFIQTYKLAHLPPVPSQSFRDFVDAQIKAGIVPKAAAMETFAAIAAAGQGDPVHTQIGWVMPIIAKNR